MTARNNRAPRPFKLSWRQTASAAVTLVFVGLLILATTSGNALWQSVGGALFSLGLVTAISDFYLRSTFAYELLDLVHISSEVDQSGFTQARAEESMDWNSILASATRFRFLLPALDAWKAREWPVILDAAQSRKVAIELFVFDPEMGVGEEVDPDDPNAELLQETLESDKRKANAQATIMSANPELHQGQISAVTQALSAAWRRLEAAKSLARGSTLKIYHVSRNFNQGLVQIDNRNFLLTYDVIDFANRPPFIVEFTRAEHLAQPSWFTRQWSDISAAGFYLGFDATAGEGNE